MIPPHIAKVRVIPIIASDHVSDPPGRAALDSRRNGDGRDPVSSSAGVADSSCDCKLEGVPVGSTWHA